MTYNQQQQTILPECLEIANIVKAFERYNENEGGIVNSPHEQRVRQLWRRFAMLNCPLGKLADITLNRSEAHLLIEIMTKWGFNSLFIQLIEDLSPILESNYPKVISFDLF